MKAMSKEILKIKDIIASSLDVKKIILFGSYANETNREGSDIDICVITDEKKRKIDILRLLRRALYSSISTPLDLLIYKSDEFANRANTLKSIEREIREQGVSIYG